LVYKISSAKFCCLESLFEQRFLRRTRRISVFLVYLGCTHTEILERFWRIDIEWEIVLLLIGKSISEDSGESAEQNVRASLPIGVLSL
jgi:hypothetical protein